MNSILRKLKIVADNWRLAFEMRRYETPPMTDAEAVEEIEDVIDELKELQVRLKAELKTERETR